VLLTERVTVDPWLRSSLTIGFLGAYTTFSTLSFVDTAENIDRVLPLLDEMVTEGMVTLERVDVIAYRAPG
jgi:fluoride ion exporter CrcB/FEX